MEEGGAAKASRLNPSRSAPLTARPLRPFKSTHYDPTKFGRRQLCMIAGGRVDGFQRPAGSRFAFDKTPLVRHGR
jgi:hypothetical protein